MPKIGVLWNYYGDAGRGDTQEEMDAYNEFNTFGEGMAWGMDNPVTRSSMEMTRTARSWCFSTHFMG